MSRLGVASRSQGQVAWLEGSKGSWALHSIRLDKNRRNGDLITLCSASVCVCVLLCVWLFLEAKPGVLKHAKGKKNTGPPPPNIYIYIYINNKRYPY